MSLDTRDARPVKQRPRRDATCFIEGDLEKKHLEKLLDAGSVFPGVFQNGRPQR